MQIAIASGKGGTGKTTVALNLAVAAAFLGREVQLLDCDVEEPNCHIFARPDIETTQTVTIPVPEVDEARCTRCGACSSACAFHAILVGPKRIMVFPELCHGCGACSYLCPEKCIREVERPIGKIEKGTWRLGDRRVAFGHGLLNTGEALAAPLVSRVRGMADPGRVTLIDAPPGTSCTMVAAIRETDLCLLVTEPTPFGLHDLEVALETAKKLGVPSAAVINRCDIGDDRVEDFCRSHELPVLLKIPLDSDLARAYAEGHIPALALPGYVERFRDLYLDVLQVAEKAPRRSGYRGAERTLAMPKPAGDVSHG